MAKLSKIESVAKQQLDDLVKEFVARYLDVYLVKRDYKAIKSFLHPEFSGVGSAIHEIARSQKDGRKLFKADCTELPDSLYLDNSSLSISWPDESTAVVICTGKLTGKSGNVNFELPNVRLTLLVNISTDGKPFICHIHMSCPQTDPGEPESYPIRLLHQQLHETEQKFRLLFDNAPVGILQYDNNAIIQACNNKFLQIMQSSEERIIGLNMMKLHDEKAIQAVKTSLTGKVGYYNGYYSATTSTAITPLRALLSPLFDHNGMIIGGIGIFEDISEFKDAQDRLQHHFRFERLVSNISTHFVDAAAEAIDVAIEEAIGMTCKFFETDRGYVFLLNTETHSISNTHEWCAPGVSSLKPKYQNFRPSNFKFIERFLNKSIDHFLCNDVSKMPDDEAEFKKILEEDQTVAILMMPLIRSGRVFGLFGYDCIKRARTWSSEEISFLKVIGEVFSNALARKETESQRILIETFNRQNERADSLGKMTEAIAHQFNNQLQIVIGNLELLDFENDKKLLKKRDDAMKAAMRAAELSAMMMAYLGETHEKCPEKKNVDLSKNSEILPRKLEGGSILVIEDEYLVRFITSSMLKHFNFTVIEAKDGVEALQILDAHIDEIRLVICDLIMPGMDGWQTLEALRKKSPSLPFILASGYDDAMALKGRHSELPQAFLRKPFNSATLQEAIRLALTAPHR